MAWVPVRAVGAVLAAVPLAYTGRRNLEGLISSLGEWWVDQVVFEENDVQNSLTHGKSNSVDLWIYGFDLFDPISTNLH